LDACEVQRRQRRVVAVIAPFERTRTAPERARLGTCRRDADTDGGECSPVVSGLRLRLAAGFGHVSSLV